MDLGLDLNLGQIRSLGGVSPTGLGAIVASNVFDVDATDALSFDTAVDTARWFNLNSAPADGEAQSAYDFFLGSVEALDGDEPAFTGSVGDADAYFLFDGSDFFQLENGNTALMNALHKAGGKGTYMVATYDVGNGLADSYGGVGVGSGDGINFVSDVGSTRNRVQIRQGGTFASPIISPVGSATNTPMVYTWTFDIDAATVKSAVNKDAYTSVGFTDASGTAIDPTGVFRIGATNTTAKLDVNTRIYAVAFFNEVLSEADRDLVIAEWETRHARTYSIPVLESFAETAMGADGTEITITKPTGTADGDLLVAILSFGADTGGDFSPPAGWTVDPNIDNTFWTSETSGTRNKMAVYTKVASSEGADYTFTYGVTSRGAGQILRFSGAGSITTEAPTGNTSASNTAPSITAPVDGSLILALFSSTNTSRSDSTAPASWTEISNTKPASDTSCGWIWTYQRTYAAGATGDATQVYTASNFNQATQIIVNGA